MSSKAKPRKGHVKSAAVNGAKIATAHLGAIEKVLAALPIGIAFLSDPTSNRVRANAAFAQLFDIDTPRKAQDFFDLVVPLGRIYRNGKVVKLEDLGLVKAFKKKKVIADSEIDVRLRNGSVRNLLAQAAPLTHADGTLAGSVGAYSDISDRKRYENTLKFLAEASNLLSLSLDRETTLESIARVCVPAFADWCAIDVVDDETSRLRTAVLYHADPQKMALGRQVRIRAGDDPDMPGPLQVVRTSKPELIETVDDDLLARVARDPSQLEIMRRLGLRSIMVVPMVARGRTIGAISFMTAESGRTYSQREVTPAQQLAYRAALAYDNARSYERERHVATSLQRAFLPSKLPQVPGLALDAFHQAGASESEVGGDWYDAFLFSDGRLGVSVGDVAGRGLRAAVVMGEVRQAFRAAALEGHSAPVVLMRADRLLKLDPNAVMVTAIFGVVDPSTSTFTYASAGHPPPLLYAPGHGVSVLPYEGLPLAVRGDDTPVEWRVALPPGSTLVLYTDGLIEYNRAVVEGESELVDAVQRVVAQGSPSPARAIQEAVLRSRPADDVAVFTVGIATTPVDRLDMTFPATPPSAPLVRQALRALATGVRIPEDKLFAMQVAVGEALNNVIEHAYGVSPGTVRLKAWTVGSQLVIDITDSGRWRPKRDDRRDEGRGRGIAIMRGLMDGVEILAEEASTTVRLTIALSGDDGKRDAVG